MAISAQTATPPDLIPHQPRKKSPGGGAQPVHMNIAFQLDGIDQLQRMRLFLNARLYDKAMRGGISYAAKSVPPAVAKGIRADYGLTSARIKQDISRIRIDPGGQSASIGFSRRPPTLSQYGARPGTRGTGQRGLGRGKGWTAPTKPGKPLTALVMRSTGRQPVRGAFMIRGNSGNQIVVRAIGQGATRRLVSVYGPSIGAIFLGNSASSKQLQADVQLRINDQFIKGFQRTLDSAARGYLR